MKKNLPRRQFIRTATVAGIGATLFQSLPKLYGRNIFEDEAKVGIIGLDTLVIKAGKPMFIDKPVAASLNDVISIYAAAKQANVPIFSSSSLRYMQSVQDVVKGKVGAVLGADTFSPATLEKTHPDLFWYGIHGVEILFTIMGTGCKQVVRIHTNDTDVVVGTWKDGRVGTFRGT